MRCLKVVALLMSLGAVAGAIVGNLVLMALALIFTPETFGGSSLHEFFSGLGVGAAVGACVGGLVGPIFALLFLRRVPLWRATVETAAIAGLGTAIGIATAVGPLWWGLGFATLAALRLRYAYRNVSTPKSDPASLS